MTAEEATREAPEPRGCVSLPQPGQELWQLGLSGVA
jgi:hypothetical protein